MKFCLAAIVYFDEASGKYLCIKRLNEIFRFDDEWLKKRKNLEGNEVVSICRER